MRLNIQTKLSGYFLIIALSFSWASFFALRKVEVARVLYQNVIGVDVPHVNALLEMGGVASDIQRIALSFQVVDASSAQVEGTKAADIKYELLASIEEIKRLELLYAEKGKKDPVESLFIQDLNKALSEITINAIDVVKLREENRSMDELDKQYLRLTESGERLKSLIKNEVQEELEELEEEQEEAEELGKEAYFLSILLSTAGVISTLILGFIVAQFFSAKIILLRNATREIARGNLKKTIRISSHDEIGDLGNAFNDMASSLMLSRAELEEKNKEVAQKLDEVERLNKLMVGRELKMIELKAEIQKLRDTFGVRESQ